MVVFGKAGKVTNDEGKTIVTPSKIIQGGGAFVWPIIQDFKKMSMKPIQIKVTVDGIDSQAIPMHLPVVLTTAISQDKIIQQNAATRFLSATPTEIEKQISEILIGETRAIMATMLIEEINADRNTFLGKVRESLEQELTKVGYDVTNINISEITDDANYIKNLGKKAETKARANAEADIAEQTKQGNIKIANTKKEEEIAVADAEREKQVQVNQTKQEQEVKVAEINREKQIKLAEAEKERESGVAVQEAVKARMLREAEAEAEATRIKLNAEAEGTKNKLMAEAEGKRASLMAEAEALQQKELAPAMAFEKMVEVAGGRPDLAVQWKTVDHLEGIAGAQAEALSKISLGNVMVYGDTSTGGKFIKDLMANVTPAIDMISTGMKEPIKNLLGMSNENKTLAPETDDANTTIKQEDNFDNVK